MRPRIRRRRLFRRLAELAFLDLFKQISFNGSGIGSLLRDLLNVFVVILDLQDISGLLDDQVRL